MLAAALALSSEVATVSAFLLVGLGLGNCFPFALAAAGMRGGVGAAVTSVATVGYTGFLMGPALIGLLTAVLSLRALSAPSSSRRVNPPARPPGPGRRASATFGLL